MNVAALALVALAFNGRAAAQTTAPTSDTEVSKQSLNPVSQQIILPFRYEADLENGVDDQAKQTFELDNAIVPFRLSDDWALITRTKMPLVVQPPKKAGDEWTAGLSNGYTTFFVSPTYGSDFYWGVGPLLSYPATNSGVGVNRWGSGVSGAFIMKGSSPWVLGAVVNNIWTFGGGSSSDQINKFLLNPFVSYHFGDGWAVGSSPNISADWIASGERWTVPVGGGFSKTVHSGKLGIKLAFDAYYNLVRAKSDKDMVVLQSTLTFLLPR